jgi:hypothetical protein
MTTMGAFRRIKASAAWRRPVIQFPPAAEVRNKYFPATPTRVHATRC